jgi:hypothetical protein
VPNDWIPQTLYDGVKQALHDRDTELFMGICREAGIEARTRIYIDINWFEPMRQIVVYGRKTLLHVAWEEASERR